MKNWLTVAYVLFIFGVAFIIEKIDIIIMKLKSHYSPTPVKWRKRGDAILYGCTSLIPIVAGSPLTDQHKVWAGTILSLIGAVGKWITNFFTEEQPKDEVQPTS